MPQTKANRMYANHFGLQRLPFDEPLDLGFYYGTPDRDEALAAMRCQIEHGSGVSLTVAMAGVGKTLLGRLLLSRLQPKECAAVVTCPPSGEFSLLHECCRALGVSLPKDATAERRIHHLKRRLRRQSTDGARTIILIDQAEHLTDAGLTELAALMDLRTASERSLTILLLAQPQFRAILDRPENARLRQELFGEKTILPLSLEQTRSYIQHRFKIAGGAETIFSSHALGLVHQASGGIPRIINKVCDSALVAAYGAGQFEVTTEEMDELASAAAPQARSKTFDELGLPGRCIASAIAQPSASSLPTITTDPIGRHRPDGHAHELRPQPPPPAECANSSPPHAHDAPPVHADRVAQRLADLIQESQLAAQRIETGLLDRLSDADRRIAQLESKLSRAGSMAAQIELGTERAQRAGERADDTASRLSGFADRLADKADELQARINSLLGNVETARAAEAALCDCIERAESQTSAAIPEMPQAADRLASLDVEIEALNRRITQAIQHGQERIADAIQRGQNSIDEAVTRAHEQVVAAIAAQQTRLVHSDEASQVLTEQLERIDARLGNARAELENIGRAAERIEAIVESTQSPLKSRLQQAGAAIIEVDRACQRVQVAHRSAEECRALVDQIKLQTETTARTLSQLKLTTEAAGDVRAALERQRGNAAGAAENLELQADAANSLLRQLEARTDNAREAADALAGATDQSCQSIQQAAAVADEQARRGIAELDLAARAAVEKAGQVVQTAMERTQDLVRDAAEQCDRLNATVEIAEAKESGLAAAAQQAATAEAQLHSTVQGTAQVKDGLIALIAQAGDNLARLGSQHAAAADTAGRLAGATVEADRRISQIEQIGTLISESARQGMIQAEEAATALKRVLQDADAKWVALAELQSSLAERAGALGAQVNLAGELTAGVQARIEQAIQCRQSVQEACEQAAESLKSTLDAAAGRAREAGEATELIVGRAADERSRVTFSADQADAVCRNLDGLLATARELIRSYQGAATEADSTLTRVTDQLAALNGSREQLTQMAERIEKVRETLSSTEAQTMRLAGTVSAMTEEPARIAAAAREQTAELERVLSAVRKVFAGLSSASLEARRQTETLQAFGATAAERQVRLESQTQQATQTLMHWVDLGVRVLSRLEDTLRDAPGIADTHPIDDLKDMLTGLKSTKSPAPPTVGRAGPIRRMNVRAIPTRTAVPADRGEEIARIIEEAAQSSGK